MTMLRANLCFRFITKVRPPRASFVGARRENSFE
jgi:hypothetical protein